tara:strand:- start:697 stop:1278 length:582 start_codon:yes stop_codon:yes gene_type:complete
MKKKTRPQTREEEMWNTVTHSAALGTTLLGLFVANSMAGRLLCLSLMITFLFSVLYHSTIHPSTKQRFRMLDMASIHMTIGVTGSAWCWLIGSAWWWAPLVPAFFGFVYTVTKFGSAALENKMVPICVLSTLLCIIIFFLGNPTGLQSLFFLTGVSIYFGGLFFYVIDDHKWYHTIWHCLVYIAALVHIWMFL